MALSRGQVASWLLSASAAVACGDEFTAGDSRDAGGGQAGTANTGGTTGGAAGSTGGSAGRGGRGGSNGTAGSSGRGGSSGTAGSAGASGTDGAGGAGSGGTAGISNDGSAGTNGSAGTGGVACDANEPKCSDGRCARLIWNFDSGSSDGISGPLQVKSFQDSLAAAVSVAPLGEVSITLQICSADGSVDLSTRTLRFRTFFEGTPASQDQFYVQAVLPVQSSSVFFDPVSASTGVWTDYSVELAMADISSTTTTIILRAGTTGVAFSGTVWFDDIAIQ
jgi:hypothetical protein